MSAAYREPAVYNECMEVFKEHSFGSSRVNSLSRDLGGAVDL